ncbi:hypothetical protein CWI38_1281p0030 [Hamiltosporidium tvaerminnensis]|uniref:Uncharacterized protein n=1 Tax=Hamiltosporidium tvaerminnensis TaxID=1176355 RepID=A0A4Q9LU58_9MICR|nr:hypothetical protein LUQ84_000399 [Hamiltosporidium tvaerminnensis]TBU11291.1 hypothetical protein CWI38_1281p0030 [Hamiltosporidium tvaerminnensis]
MPENKKKSNNFGLYRESNSGSEIKREILIGLMHVMRISSDPGTVTSSCMHPMEKKKSYTTENMNGCYGKGSEMFNIISER